MPVSFREFRVRASVLRFNEAAVDIDDAGLEMSCPGGVL
jgi:hypothetical protein